MKTDSNNPGDWILFASRDLAGVRLLAASQVSFELCQSNLAEIVEKILKAELIRRGWFLEKTHDLHKLAALLYEHDPALAEEFRELVISLADAYFSARYLGFDLDEPDWTDLTDKIEQAEKLLQETHFRILSTSSTDA